MMGIQPAGRRRCAEGKGVSSSKRKAGEGGTIETSMGKSSSRDEGRRPSQFRESGEAAGGALT